MTYHHIHTYDREQEKQLNSNLRKELRCAVEGKIDHPEVQQVLKLDLELKSIKIEDRTSTDENIYRVFCHLSASNSSSCSLSKCE